MSSIAVLTTPSQDTKPGFTIYSESLVSKNTVSEVINTTNIESKTNLTVNAATNLNLGPGSSNIAIGSSTCATAITGGLMVNNVKPTAWNASLYTEPSPVFDTPLEFSMINSTDSVAGSMTIKPRVGNGFTLKIFNGGTLTLGFETTLTIRLKINGSTILEQNVPSGAVVGQGFTNDIVLNYRANGDFNTCTCGGRIIREADDTIINYNTSSLVWDPTIDNTISLTGQFSDGNGSWVTSIFDMVSSQCT